MNEKFNVVNQRLTELNQRIDRIFDVLVKDK